MSGPWYIGANGPVMQDGHPVLIDEDAFVDCCCPTVWICIESAEWQPLTDDGDCDGNPATATLCFSRLPLT